MNKTDIRKKIGEWNNALSEIESSNEAIQKCIDSVTESDKNDIETMPRLDIIVGKQIIFKAVPDWIYIYNMFNAMIEDNKARIKNIEDEIDKLAKKL